MPSEKRRTFFSVFNALTLTITQLLLSLIPQPIDLEHFKQWPKIPALNRYKVVQNTRRKTIYQKTHALPFIYHSSQSVVCSERWTMKCKDRQIFILKTVGKVTRSCSLKIYNRQTFKSHQIPKPKCFSFRLAAVLAQSIEVRCKADKEYIVGAAPTGDVPTISEWSTILLPTRWYSY